MSMPRTLGLLLVASTLAACVAVPSATSDARAGSGSLGIGRPASVAEIRGWDIEVGADGTGLPPGQGSVLAGKQVYDGKCAACHGATGTGGPAPALVGGIGSLATARPVLTVGSYWPYAPTVYDYINRAMPWDRPQSLSADEVYAVTAYLLHINQIVPAQAVMNAQTLPAVRMPNRDGFITPAREPEIPGVRCMRNC